MHLLVVRRNINYDQAYFMGLKNVQEKQERTTLCKRHLRQRACAVVYTSPVVNNKEIGDKEVNH